MTKMQFRHDRITLPEGAREIVIHDKGQDMYTMEVLGYLPNDPGFSRSLAKIPFTLPDRAPIREQYQFGLQFDVDGAVEKIEGTLYYGGKPYHREFAAYSVQVHVDAEGYLMVGLQTTAKADAPPQTATPVVEPICEGPTHGKIGDLEIPNVKIVPNEPLTDDWWKRSQMQTVGVTFYTPRDEHGRLRNILEWTSGHVLVTVNGMVTSHPILADAIAFEEPITSLYVLWQFGSRCFITTDKIEEYLDKPGHIIVAYLNRLTGLSIAMGPTTIVLPPKKEKAPANG